MIHAYAEHYLNHARTNFGRMLDTAVNSLHYPLTDFYGLFLKSSIASRFANGEPKTIAGVSGIELVFGVLEENSLPIPEIIERTICSESPEFWAGWALAYYQYQRCRSFAEINSIIPIEDVVSLYIPYHEMDIIQFVDALDEIYRQKNNKSRLKAHRNAAGLSQSELAALAGIPLRTLQQYEQVQKNLCHARADYLLSLAQVLHCPPVELLDLDLKL